MTQETLSTLNTRTGVKKKKEREPYAFEYWAPTLEGEWDELTGFDEIMHLAGLRRGAANFVNILTGRNDINVRFSSGTQSYAVEDEVVISADTNPKKFDGTVGLALHEAAHCLLTDYPMGTFAFITNPEIFFNKLLLSRVSTEYLTTLFNLLEDRRIDSYVYRNAVGYRPYYDAIYARYWQSKNITAALRSKWTTPTWESYLERIINISNPAARETQHLLPGLKNIYDMIDLDNIHRFDAEPVSFRKCVRISVTRNKKKRIPDVNKIPKEWFKDSWDIKSGLSDEHIPEIIKLVERIARRIIEEIDAAAVRTTPGHADGTNTPVNESAEGLERGEEKKNELPNLDTAPPAKKGAKKQSTDKPKKEPKVNEKALRKELANQKKFLKGKTTKKKIDKAINKDVAAMEDAKAKVHRVGNQQIGQGRVLVTHRVNEQVMSADWWSFSNVDYYGKIAVYPERVKAIADGIRMGQILAHRLQIRNEQTLTKFPNQPSGVIDRRVLARLGMNLENVFARLQKDQYRPTLIHISLDASSSMSSYFKWDRALTVATALTYAAYKINNLDVVVSIRGQVQSDEGMAHMAICHDTREHSFVTFRRTFERINPKHSTPEGLCFEAIMDFILEDAHDYQMYFINISDGEPMFTAMPIGSKRVARTYRNRRRSWAPIEHVRYKIPEGTKQIEYKNATAWYHTRQQVNKMREAGIQVLSYFVHENKKSAWNTYETNGRTERAKDAFRTMYGDDAQFVDVTNLTSIVNTMNMLLLKR